MLGKLSRNLYPQFKRHGLSEIIKRFKLNIENRHRALDDAQMVYDFFVKTSAIYSAQEIEACCKQLLKRTTLPPLLDPEESKKSPIPRGSIIFMRKMANCCTWAKASIFAIGC